MVDMCFSQHCEKELYALSLWDLHGVKEGLWDSSWHGEDGYDLAYLHFMWDTWKEIYKILFENKAAALVVWAWLDIRKGKKDFLFQGHSKRNLMWLRFSLLFQSIPRF